MNRLSMIRRTILEILEEIEPFALPEPQLKLHLDARMRPPVAAAEMEDAITWLNVRQHIRPLSDHLAPEDSTAVKWLITETGKTLLRK